MTTDKITAIKKQIEAKLEKGEDVSELSRQLAEETAKTGISKGSNVDTPRVERESPSSSSNYTFFKG